MPDYKEMYITLFRSVTQAITLLQEVQRQTEEMYISAKQLDIRVLDIQSFEKDCSDKEKC